MATKIKYLGILLGLVAIATIGYFGAIRLNVQRNKSNSRVDVTQQVFSDLTISQLINSNKPEAPHLIDQQPEPGQELPLNGVIKLGFDQTMDQLKTVKALKITNSKGEVVKGDFSWTDPKTIQFTPDKYFNSGNRYNVNLSTGIENTQGIP